MVPNREGAFLPSCLMTAAGDMRSYRVQGCKTQRDTPFSRFRSAIYQYANKYKMQGE